MSEDLFGGIGPVAWAARIRAARIRAAESAKTPEQRAADIAWMDEWMASLCELPPLPLRPGQVVVVFNSREKKGGSHMAKGQGMVEYALILSLVAVVVMVVLALLGPAIAALFSRVISNL